MSGLRSPVAGLDPGLAGAFRRILHAVDMVEVGLVPLDRVGRRVADENLAHQRMRQAAGILAPGLVVERADLAHQMLELDQRRDQKTGAMAHGTRTRRRCGGADPQRQRTGLDRRRTQQPALHLVHTPFVVEALAAPGQTENVQQLLEGGRALLVVPAEAFELGRTIALSQTDLDAANREIVEHRQILGETQRMAMQGRQRDGLADAAVGSRDGQRRTGDDGRRAVAVGFAVMLADPDRSRSRAGWLRAASSRPSR